MWEGITDEHELEIYKLIKMLPRNGSYSWYLNSLPNVLERLVSKDDIDNIKVVTWLPAGVHEDLLVLDHEDQMVFEVDDIGKFVFLIEKRPHDL